MANQKKRKGFKNTFNNKHVEIFQNVSAEREDNLLSYYVANEYFKAAKDFNSKRSFFIARTGMGKTAILENIRKTVDKNWVLSIDPESFAFTIMEKSEILKVMSKQGINLDLFYKTMWKYIIVSELLRRRFGNERKNWLQQQYDRVADRPARLAYKFLLKNEEIGSGLSFSERVKAIVSRLEYTVKLAFEKAGIKSEISGQLTDENKKIVHEALVEFEFTDLNYFLNILDDHVIGKNSYYILVDDLDKTWIQNKVGINFTRCLFETIFDFNSLKRLRLLVSLRTNLFKQLKFHQTEKFLAYIQQIYWTDEQLKQIIEVRFQNALGVSATDLWDQVFPARMKLDNKKEMTAFKYLLSRSSRRPRDIFIYIGYILSHAQGKNKVTAEIMRDAENQYSKDRLAALFEEWKNPYINLEFIKNHFMYTNYKLTKAELWRLLEDAVVEVLSREESGSLDGLDWLFEGEFEKVKTGDPEAIFRLLYRIGFLGWKPAPDSKMQYCFNLGFQEADDPVSEGARFYINPCFYRALHTSFNMN